MNGLLSQLLGVALASQEGRVPNPPKKKTAKCVRCENEFEPTRHRTSLCENCLPNKATIAEADKRKEQK